MGISKVLRKTKLTKKKNLTCKTIPGGIKYGQTNFTRDQESSW